MSLTQAIQAASETYVDVTTGSYSVRNATVIGADGRRQSGITIDISDGTIKRIEHEPADDGNALSIDADGLVALPGFIDAHVHITGQRETDPYRRYLATPSHVLLVQALCDAVHTVLAGFTSARDCGFGSPAVALKGLIDQRLSPGPTLDVAHRAISQVGGACDWHYLPLPTVQQSEFRGVLANGVDEFVLAVRRNFREGATFTKIMATSGNLDVRALYPPRTSLRKDEATAAIEMTHQLGGRCAAHAMGSDGVRLAVEAGADTIEHGLIHGDWTILDLMAERGTILVPTLSIFHLMRQEGAENGMSQWAIDEAGRALETQFEMIHRAREAGVQIAAGTDLGSRFGPGRNALELVLLERAGMSPMECLTAATLTSAQALGVEDDRGTLEVGKRADIVLWRLDPLANLQGLLEKSAVARVLKSVRDPDSDAAAGSMGEGDGG